MLDTKIMALMVAVVIVAGTVGYQVGVRAVGESIESNNHNVASHNVDTMDHSKGSHEHGLMTVIENAPTVDFEIVRQSNTSADIKLTTTNFTFTPENADGAHVAGEGHAHLYIDGKKITRLYGDWYQISGLEAGEYEVKVSLNTNDHRGYATVERMVEMKKMLLIGE